MVEVLRIVVFLLLANGLPPIVSIFAGERFNRPVDGGIRWVDGRPLFGRHKTIRGLLAAVAGGTLAFPLPGIPWQAAGIAAALAMAGDLTSSFIKRRLALPSGRTVIILDQLFEVLFPLLFLNRCLPLAPWQNGAALLIFIAASSLGSHLWYQIVGRPLPQTYPRKVSSRVRLREWRACHEPLARWQTWFNLTSFLSDQILLTWLFKLTGLYSLGKKNALDIRLEERCFSFPTLPPAFDGFRIMLLADLHLDGLEGLDGRIREVLQQTTADLCCIGGDFRMKTYGPSSECIARLKALMPHVPVTSRPLGVLGNHDCIEMLPDLEDAGIVMLVNDAWPIVKSGARIWIIGVDDPHYYRLHDADQAAGPVQPEEFSIFLAHSPEAFKDAARINADLYLCGHTHGGQICLRWNTPIITNSRAPRRTAVAAWQYGTMQGYTSRGVAPSSIPIRFNCPGEISIITLKRGDRRDCPPTG